MVKEKQIRDVFKDCFEDVFRTETHRPGFCLLDLGPDVNSLRLREVMVMMKKTLSRLTKDRFSQSLNYQWLGRFDQQASTKYHLDNAPNQSFLMLGYEPSEIESELYIADYVKLSQDHGISSGDFFERYNPIYADHEDALKPYISRVKPFNKDSFRIVLINNSNGEAPRDTLGVLHMARMVNPDLEKSRVVNSMMLAMSSEEKNSDKQAEETFLITDHVSS